MSSGTAALGLALAFARQLSAARANTALLPGYGCPDLVAAARFAQLTPQLVDVEADTPWLSLTQLERRLSDATAVVAVNFLGMPERLGELTDLTRRAGIPLIEDSAQMAPFAGGSQPMGDLVVYSFGRGKPVSLLAGGALLVRRDWSERFESLFPAVPAAETRWGYYLKCLAHNVATRPSVYAWARRIPFLGIGRVEFSPLTGIDGIPKPVLDHLATAYARLPTRPSSAQERLESALTASATGLVALPAKLQRSNYPVLRFPVLARDGGQRDALVARLDRAGLGASPFYGQSLAELPGVPGLAPAEVRNASDFARRLFTLPVHPDVAARDLDAMARLLATAVTP